MTPLRWTPCTILLLFIKNLTGSGKWNTRYYRAHGYDIHPTAQVNGYLDTTDSRSVTVSEGAVVANAARIIAHGIEGEGKRVHIGHHAYIGTGAIVLGVNIGYHAIVGAGSVVTHDIPHGQTWVGNPARRVHP